MSSTEIPSGSDSDEVSEPALAKKADDLLRGTLRQWNNELGAGSLEFPDGSSARIAEDDLCEHLRPVKKGERANITGPVVVHYIGEETKGKRSHEAYFVQCEQCAEPPRWELQPVGDPIFGVQKVQPVCINKAGKLKPPSEFSRQAEEANTDFYKAQGKKDRFLYRPLDEIYFQEFGEPTAARVDGENIVLEYDHGQRSEPLNRAMEAGHWEIAATGTLETQSNGEVRAEFECAAFPGVRALLPVAYLGSDLALPTLKKSFDRLSPEIREQVLSTVMERVPSPEEYAERVVRSELREDSGTSGALNIFSDIYTLNHAAGCWVRYHDYEVESTYNEDRDPRWAMPFMGSRYKIHGRNYFLEVNGGPPTEESRKPPFPEPVHEIVIGTPEGDEKPENVRMRVLGHKEQDFKDRCERARSKHMAPPDIRLSSSNPEEWGRRYDTAFSHAIAVLTKEWTEEIERDSAHVATQREEYQSTRREYASTLEQLQPERDRARTYGIVLDDVPQPKSHYADDILSLDEIRSRISELHTVIAAIQEKIKRTLDERGVREFQDQTSLSEAMNAPSGQAQWYISGVDTSWITEQFGRKVGEGFGDQVAGKSLRLPGDQALVGINVFGSREAEAEVVCHGLRPLKGIFPESVGKKERAVLGLVDDPNWSVKVRRGSNFFELWNARGYGSLYYFGTGEVGYASHNWSKQEGQGPAEQEIRQAFGIPDDSREAALMAIPDDVKKFAEECANTVGSARVIDLFSGQLHAEYGMRGRLQAILERIPTLGQTESGKRFLASCTRAADLNYYLQGAITWLTNRQSTPHSGQEAQISKVHVEQQSEHAIIAGLWEISSGRNIRHPSNDPGHCEYAERLTKTQMTDYESGKEVVVVCKGCKRAGTIQTTEGHA